MTDTRIQIFDEEASLCNYTVSSCPMSNDAEMDSKAVSGALFLLEG